MHLFEGWQYHILIRSLLQLLYIPPQILPPLLSTHRIGKMVMRYVELLAWPCSFIKFFKCCSSDETWSQSLKPLEICRKVSNVLADSATASECSLVANCARRACCELKLEIVALTKMRKSKLFISPLPYR